jgi:hypothetical protein
MTKLKDSVAEFAEPTTSVVETRAVRTPKMIKHACKRLSRLWRKHPHLKLGELISGAYSDSYLINIRKVGDGKLLESLELFYGIDDK